MNARISRAIHVALSKQPFASFDIVERGFAVSHLAKASDEKDLKARIAEYAGDARPDGFPASVPPPRPTAT